MVENLPEPPEDDEIEERLERLKYFNKELLDDINESAAAKGSKVKIKVVAEKSKYVKVEKPDDKRPKDLYDKFDHESGSIDVKGMHDFMYMQVPTRTGKKDEMSKQTDASAIVAFLQAIFAILLVSGKTLHEQSLLITSLSKLSQPCLLNHLQTESLLSPSLPCSRRQSQIRRCCDITITTPMLTKVTRRENAANARFAWLRRTFTALCSVSEVVVAAGALVGWVVYQGLVPGA